MKRRYLSQQHPQLILNFMHDKGYEAGRIEYCSQSLGRKGEQYHGICDSISGSVLSLKVVRSRS